MHEFSFFLCVHSSIAQIPTYTGLTGRWHEEVNDVIDGDGRGWTDSVHDLDPTWLRRDGSLWKWRDFSRTRAMNFRLYCVICVVRELKYHTYKLALCKPLSEEDTSRPHYVVQHVAVLNQSAQRLLEHTLAPSFLLLFCVHLPSTTQHCSSQLGAASFYRWCPLTGEGPIGLQNRWLLPLFHLIRQN